MSSKKKKKGQLSSVLRRLAKNKLAMLGLIVFVIEILIAVFAPHIIPYSYEELDFAATFQAPSAEHWFGTDAVGRDMFSRVIYGTRYSMLIGVLAMLLCNIGGIVIGSIAGFFGGQIDNLLMRMFDIIGAIPSILLMIVIAAAMGNSIPIMILVIAIGGLAGCARLFRGQVLKVRGEEYIEAAIAMNCSKTRIIISHVIPNAFSPMIVNMTLGVANAILSAASLSFIGLGIPAPEPEWGSLLSTGRQTMLEHPHLVIFPGLAIMVTVFALNIFGDGLRDALDPKLKN